MQTPSIGRIVIARNVMTQGDECPAIITRVRGGQGVNLTIFPDGCAPVFKTSVQLQANLVSAVDHEVATMSKPLQAYWPTGPVVAR